MNFLHNLLLILQVASSVGVIGLVLVQHGKGADMGAAFGSGASGSVFGATGSANFLSRTTAVLATVFFASTLALSWVATDRPQVKGGVLDAVPVESVEKAAPAVAPAAPATSDIPK